MGIFNIFVFSSCLFVVAFTKENYESRIEECRSKTNDIDVCVRDLLNYIKPKYKIGIPELDLPPVDPFIIDSIYFERDDGLLKLRSNFTDIKAHGYSNVTYRRIKTDFATRTFKIQSRTPKFYVEGNYHLKGSFLSSPVEGSGSFYFDIDGSFDSLVADLYVNKTGGEHMSIRNSKITLNFGKLKIHLDNLFNGDPVLGKTVNHFLNENSDLLMKQLDSDLSGYIAEISEPLINKIVSLFPTSLLQ